MNCYPLKLTRVFLLPNGVRYFVAAIDIVQTTKVDLDDKYRQVTLPTVEKYNADMLNQTRVPHCMAQITRNHIRFFL